MSATPKPLVSIGVPVWNGENYLRQALASLAEQTYENLEILIADNGSIDGTEAIARDFTNRDPRFSYVRHATNLGASANYNYCFHHTSGPLFRWAAHDDLIEPSYVERCVDALYAHPDSVLAYTHTIKIDAAGNQSDTYRRALDPVGPSVSERVDQMLGSVHPMDSVLHMCFPVFGLMRRSALEQTSLIANFPRSDHLLIFELALLGGFTKIEAPLFLRREHDEGSVISAEKQTDGANREKQLANWFDPNKGKSLPTTNTNLWVGYTKAALRIPASETDRLKAIWLTLRWGLRRFRVIQGEVRRVAIAKLLRSG